MRWFRLLALVVTLGLLLVASQDAVANTFACCTAGVCTEVTEPTCTAGGGTSFPAIPLCANFNCPAPVPSVGSAGLTLLAVALLGAATWLLVRRTRSAPES